MVKMNIGTWLPVLVVGCFVELVVPHTHKTSPPLKPAPVNGVKRAAVKPEDVHRAMKKSEDMKHHYEHVANIDFDLMSDKEITFHFFKLHDFDSNHMLDGLEIIKGLAHVMGQEMDGNYVQDDFEDMVDHMMETGDKNNDGYLTYAEYSISDIFSADNPDSIHNY